MAKKGRTVFVCQECGYESAKWLGQCVCGAWNTFVEERVQSADDDVRRRGSVAIASDGERKRNPPVRLSEVQRETNDRLDT